MRNVNILNPHTQSLKKELYEHLKNTNSFESFTQTMGNILGNFGIKRWAYTLQDLPKNIGPQEQMGNIEKDFIQSYMADKLYEHDLILQHIRRSISPIFLSDVADHINNSPLLTDHEEGYKEIVHRNIEFGHFDTYNIPIISSYDGARAVLSLTSKDMNINNFKENMAKNLQLFKIFAEVVYEIGIYNYSDIFLKPICDYNSLIKSQPFNFLATMGKYDLKVSEAAKKFNITESTATKHLKTMRDYFDAKTNCAAYDRLKKYLE